MHGHGRGGHSLPPSLRKLQSAPPDSHFESLVNHASTLLSPEEIAINNNVSSTDQNETFSKKVKVTGSPSDITRSLNSWLQAQAGPGWQGRVSVTSESHPGAATGADIPRAALEFNLISPGKESFSVVLGEGILKAALWLTRATFNGNGAEAGEKVRPENCGNFGKYSSPFYQGSLQYQDTDNLGSSDDDGKEGKDQESGRNSMSPKPKFSTYVLGTGKRCLDPSDDSPEPSGSKRRKESSSRLRVGPTRRTFGPAGTNRVSYKDMNDGTIHHERIAPPEKPLSSFETGRTPGFLEEEVLSETDPLVVPVLCGDTPMQGFLKPFCGRRDAVILHKGKSLTGYEFERISGKAYNKKWKQSVKVAAGFGVVCGKGDVGAWLQATGGLLGHQVVGRRLAVYWEDHNIFYAARIKSFLEQSGEHQVMYDNGETERLQLALQKLKWLAEPGDPRLQDPEVPSRCPGVEAALKADKRCGKCDACVASGWLPSCPTVPCYETVVACAAEQGCAGAVMAAKKHALIGKYISVKLASPHGGSSGGAKQGGGGVLKRGQVLAFYPKQFTHKVEFDDRHEEYIQLWQSTQSEFFPQSRLLSYPALHPSVSMGRSPEPINVTTDE